MSKLKQEERCVSSEGIVLDVGCGPYGIGDLNIDITLFFENGTSSFVQASATELPFRPNSIDEVYSIGLSLLQERFHEKDLKKWVNESLLVASDRLLIEYAYNRTRMWCVRSPEEIERICGIKFGQVINVSRGFKGRIIRIVEKIIGRKLLITVLLKFGQSYRFRCWYTKRNYHS